MFQIILKYVSVHKISSLNNHMRGQSYMYEYLFRDCFEYFYNLNIILSMLDNFKDEIVNFVVFFF